MDFLYAKHFTAVSSIEGLYWTMTHLSGAGESKIARPFVKTWPLTSDCAEIDWTTVPSRHVNKRIEHIE